MRTGSEWEREADGEGVLAVWEVIMETSRSERWYYFGKHQWCLPDLEDPLVKECNKNVEKDGQVGGGPKWE